MNSQGGSLHHFRHRTSPTEGKTMGDVPNPSRRTRRLRESRRRTTTTETGAPREAKP